jgi:phage terminase large subunit-like protein
MVSASERILRNLPTVVQRGLRMAQTESTEDSAAWDWYSETCPCNLPPGECRIHPRARASQRPPEGPWNKHLFLAGRGSGKSRSGAEWVRHIAETGQARRIAVVGATAADVRDTMILGESGLMSVCPPWFKPVYHSTLRRLVFPNGSTCLTYSAEEPDRLRGPNFDHAWIDEIAAWDRAQETFDNLAFALRIGTNPRVFMTTTPRATKFVKGLLADPAVHVSKCSTYDNRAHLAPAFFSAILAKYEGSRLGAQEIMADVLDTSEAAVFQHFNDSRNVTERAEYRYGRKTWLAVDAGVSRYTGGVFFQSYPRDAYRTVVTVLADFLSVDQTSLENAQALKALASCLPCDGHLDGVLLDPAASARSGNGPAAKGEYEAVFGSRLVSAWPQHRVHDGIDQLEILIGGPNREPDLLIHPRCVNLIDALKTYRYAEKRGEVLDSVQAVQHPAEDLTDAIRGGVRFLMPEGHAPKPELRSVPARVLF